MKSEYSGDRKKITSELFPLSVDTSGKTLIKHSAIIQIANKPSLLERKVSNILLWHARPKMDANEVHEISLKDLKFHLEYNNNNDDYIKDAIRSLAQTFVEYNILAKDRKNIWGVAPILDHAEIQDGWVRYGYTRKIRALLSSPDMYARLDLTVQRHFRSKHAIALWEYLTDALGGKRQEATVLLELPPFRKLMNIQDHEYAAFRDLQKRVIQPALQDINEHTNLHATLRIGTVRKKACVLYFDVQKKEGTPEGSALVGGQILDELLAIGITSTQAASLPGELDAGHVRAILKSAKEGHAKGRVKNLPAYVFKMLRDTVEPQPPIPTPAAPEKPQDSVGHVGGKEWVRRFDAWRAERAKELFEALPKKEQLFYREKFQKGLALLPESIRKKIESHGDAAFYVDIAWSLLKKPEEIHLEIFRKTFSR